MQCSGIDFSDMLPEHGGVTTKAAPISATYSYFRPPRAHPRGIPDTILSLRVDIIFFITEIRSKLL